MGRDGGSSLGLVKVVRGADNDEVQHKHQDAVIAELDRLTSEEAAVSEQRHRLHLRIERLYLDTPHSPEDEALLAELTEAELWISRWRADVHRRIDALRAEIGLPAAYPGSDTAAA